MKMMEGENVSPGDFNHVGISIPDLDEAIVWYCDVLGFSLLAGPNEIELHQSAGGEQARDVLGPNFKRMRMAHLVTPNGIGIELFQLIDPPHEPSSGTVEYWQGGIFHLCITHPDIEGLAKKIVERGGRQLSKIWLERPPSSQHKMVYCSDPFGTVIELYTHSYTEMQGNR
jgi:catechol 2,3-dioxygenase-like lactoylglutathione lyase family enzyme